MTTSVLLGLLMLGSLFRTDLGPALTPVSVDTPVSWNITASSAVSADVNAVSVNWWKDFNDAGLVLCVEEALSRNKDLEIALARVQRARAVLQETAGAQSPTLSAQADIARGRAIGSFAGSQSEQNSNQLYGAVHYEADLWSRLKKSTQAARQDFLASQAARDGVYLTIAGNVSLAYFNLRGADARLRIAKDTLAARQESYALQKIRYENGLTGELDLRRDEAELATAAITVQQLEDAISKYETALMVLMGRTPQELINTPAVSADIAAVSIDALPAPPSVPLALPSELLARRPDIKQYEQEYLAAMSRVGVANAARYPSLSLSGLLGTSANNPENFFTGPTGWGLAAALVAPLLDGNKRISRLEQAKAAAWEAASRYEKTAQVAFQETKDALTSCEKTEQIYLQLAQKEAAQRRAYELADILYQSGSSGMLDMLDARRQLFAVQLDLENAKKERLNAAVSLYMALGGGFYGEEK